MIWSYEHPEKIESFKDNFKKNNKPQIINVDSNRQTYTANSFEVNLKKIIEFKEKTAFITYLKDKKKFTKEKIKIYLQNGFTIENSKQKKLNLPKYFTLQRNGGVKTIMSVDGNEIALISGKEKNCFFCSINLSTKWKRINED